MLVTLLCACGFHSDPLLADPNGNAERDAYAADGKNDAGSDEDDGPDHSSGSAGSAGGDGMDAGSTQLDASSIADAATTDARAPDAKTTDSGGAADASMDAEAAPDAEPPQPDAAPQPDANDAQECECVCPHDFNGRLEDPPAGCELELCATSECAPEADCDYVTEGESGYYVCPEPHDWTGAKEHCDSISGIELVGIESEEEDEFLLSELDDKTWIGGSDREMEGVFRWQNDEVFWRGGAALPGGGGPGPGGMLGGGPPPGVYANFLSYEPNNLGLENEPGDCVLLWPDQDSWADATCDDEHGYVCEFPVPLPP